jgi:hypothetical protein
LTITNVAWARDHRHRPVLKLELDGQPAHIPSGQKSKLLRRGIVEGVVFFTSQRSSQLPNAFMRGDFGPELTEGDLIGCTDDPEVFALFQEMCGAIRADTWRAGPRAPAA